MPYNPLEYLKAGKTDFVYDHITSSDRMHLIERVRKHPDRIEIINGFLSKSLESMPYFCFAIIYDIPEFQEEAYKLFDLKLMNSERLGNMLNNSPLGLKILYENFETFLVNDEDDEYKNYFDVVLKYAFDSNNKDLLHRLSIYDDLHIRFQFMSYLIDNHPDRIDDIYSDITDYVTSVTYEPNEQLTFLPKLMDQKEVSKLAVKLLVSKRKESFIKLKEFILKEYKRNSLAEELLKPERKYDPDNHKIYDDPNIEMKQKTFEEDSDILFRTSLNFQLSIYSKYSDRIRKELLEDFENKIKYYLNSGKKDEFKGFFGSPAIRDLRPIYKNGLGPLLEEWTEKYMDLSKSKEYGYVNGGTTCNCYRIGDYVFKLVATKWSYEDVICPNLYLIAKDYEEIYVRDSSGVVVAGLEVQKFLTKNAKDVDTKYIDLFEKALEKEGYYRTDTLINGSCGENAMVLDSYKDADCNNPDRLPDWFKECPIVIIDRDRIYPKGLTFIRQQRSYPY